MFVCVILNDWLTIQMCKTTLINENGDYFFFFQILLGTFQMTYITAHTIFVASVAISIANSDKNIRMGNHAKGSMLAMSFFETTQEFVCFFMVNL